MPKIKECLELEHSIKYFCCSTLESRVDFSHPNLTKIVVTYQTKEEAIEKAKQINDLFGSFANAFYVTKNSVEITSSLASKEKGIEEIVKRKNIAKKNIYRYSDIKMIQKFNGFGMQESVEEIKKSAKKLYPSVSLLIKDILEGNIK